MGSSFDKLKNHEGFTLIELLVALVVSSVVIAAVYSLYDLNVKTNKAQKQIVAMQQNARSAMFYMKKEIRLAGYDPTGISNAGILTADPSQIQFSHDLDGDGDTTTIGDTITYFLYDSGGDGDTDLGRRVNAATQPVAENISALNFVYLDKDGNITPVLADIRTVQVTLVAKTDENDFRTRELTSRIKCRNLGLKY